VISHYVESFFLDKKNTKKENKNTSKQQKQINAVIYRRMINLTTIFGV